LADWLKVIGVFCLNSTGGTNHLDVDCFTGLDYFFEELPFNADEKRGAYSGDVPIRLRKRNVRYGADCLDL
jgi:hypothetical protein